MPAGNETLFIQPSTSTAHKLNRADAKIQVDSNLSDIISQVENFHNHLADEYGSDALIHFETYLYDVGSWFNKIQLIDHSFHKWLWKSSEACQKQVVDVIDKANLAAVSFQDAQRNRYRRAFCKRKVEDLLFAIKNLQVLNSRRA